MKSISLLPAPVLAILFMGVVIFLMGVGLIVHDQYTRLQLPDPPAALLPPPVAGLRLPMQCRVGIYDTKGALLAQSDAYACQSVGYMAISAGDHMLIWGVKSK